MAKIRISEFSAKNNVCPVTKNNRKNLHILSFALHPPKNPMLASSPSLFTRQTWIMYILVTDSFVALQVLSGGARETNTENHAEKDL